MPILIQLKDIKDLTFTLKYKHKLRHVYHNMIKLVHIYILLKKVYHSYLGEFDHLLELNRGCQEILWCACPCSNAHWSMSSKKKKGKTLSATLSFIVHSNRRTMTFLHIKSYVCVLKFNCLTVLNNESKVWGFSFLRHLLTTWPEAGQSLTAGWTTLSL